MQRDCDDFFYNSVLVLQSSAKHLANTFNLPAGMMCLGSGFIDGNNIVNCNRAGKIGAYFQESLNNQTFTACSFIRKNQIKTLQRLYSSIPVE